MLDRVRTARGIVRSLRIYYGGRHRRALLRAPAGLGGPAGAINRVDIDSKLFPHYQSGRSHGLGGGRSSVTTCAFKRPRTIRFLDELPRNALGKVVKHELPRGD